MTIENLHGYGKVTTAMKAAGGPEKYLFSLRRNAFIAGAAVTVAGVIMVKRLSKTKTSNVVSIDTKMSEDKECQHPEESVEYDPGNYVPPYGWEQWPGWYCHDCGEMMDEEEVEPDEVDPDFEIKYEKENPR